MDDAGDRIAIAEREHCRAIRDVEPDDLRAAELLRYIGVTMRGRDARYTEVEDRARGMRSDEAEAAGNEYHERTMPSLATPGLEESVIAIRRELRGVVDAIAVFRSNGPRYVSLPRGCVQLLIRDARAYVIGPHVRVLRKPATTEPVVAIRLAVGAAPALFGIPASELADRAVPLAELWPARGLDLQTELARRAANATFDHAMMRAARRLAAEPALRIEQLARELSLGVRQLHRRFTAAAGLSPKRYAKVARIRRAIALAGAAAPWAEIAVDAGFYDQAHLISEFHAIAGATPQALLAEIASASSPAPV
jgi:AraC-like DNA-binding protein